MEHRWGSRRHAEIVVLVDLGQNVLERGVILDVSASGLRVRMPAGLELMPHTMMTVLHVERGPERPHRVRPIEALVVRQSGHDVGVTYAEFNPPEASALLHLAEAGSALSARVPAAPGTGAARRVGA